MSEKDFPEIEKTDEIVSNPSKVIKTKQRAEIEEQVKQFLASGNKIETVEPCKFKITRKKRTGNDHSFIFGGNKNAKIDQQVQT